MKLALWIPLFLATLVVVSTTSAAGSDGRASYLERLQESRRCTRLCENGNCVYDPSPDYDDFFTSSAPFSNGIRCVCQRGWTGPHCNNLSHSGLGPNDTEDSVSSSFNTIQENSQDQDADTSNGDPMTEQGTTVHASASVACSGLTVCHNGGTCRKGSKTYDLSNVALPYHNEHLEHCVCPDGYTGVHCELEVQVCAGSEDNVGDGQEEQEDHYCLHGSTCVQETPGVYSCDCSTTTVPANFFGGVYAGKHCEYEATQVCDLSGDDDDDDDATASTVDGDGGSTRGTFAAVTRSPTPDSSNSYNTDYSITSFCTNGGICKDFLIYPGEPHPGCLCRDEWMGRYCEIPVPDIHDDDTAAGSDKTLLATTSTRTPHGHLETGILHNFQIDDDDDDDDDGLEVQIGRYQSGIRGDDAGDISGGTDTTNTDDFQIQQGTMQGGTADNMDDDTNGDRDSEPAAEDDNGAPGFKPNHGHTFIKPDHGIIIIDDDDDNANANDANDDDIDPNPPKPDDGTIVINDDDTDIKTDDNHGYTPIKPDHGTIVINDDDDAINPTDDNHGHTPIKPDHGYTPVKPDNGDATIEDDDNAIIPSDNDDISPNKPDHGKIIISDDDSVSPGASKSSAFRPFLAVALAVTGMTALLIGWRKLMLWRHRREPTPAEDSIWIQDEEMELDTYSDHPSKYSASPNNSSGSILERPFQSRSNLIAYPRDVEESTRPVTPDQKPNYVGRGAQDHIGDDYDFPSPSGDLC